MSSQKKPMATVRAADPAYNVNAEIENRLSGIAGVTSVQRRWLDDGLNIWVGVREGDDDSRKMVYEFEDFFLDRFRNIRVDFHVVSIPTGRSLQDYVSDAEIVFQRIAVA